MTIDVEIVRLPDNNRFAFRSVHRGESILHYLPECDRKRPNWNRDNRERIKRVLADEIGCSRRDIRLKLK